MSKSTTVNLATAEQLAGIIRRIEAIRDEAAALANDEREIFKEAKSIGFDVKVIRSILTNRTKDPEALKEGMTVYDTYVEALGILVGTPLGQWAQGHQADRSKARLNSTLATNDLKVSTVTSLMDKANLQKTKQKEEAA